MWKVRHQGSPSALGDLTLAQVAEGLADGQWEPTDEVMGPGDTTWVPIESHPQLEERRSPLTWSRRRRAFTTMRRGWT
jgi:hypothetical protein